MNPSPDIELVAMHSKPADAVSEEMRTMILRIALRLGYTRSIGEIYGLLYVSQVPLSMAEIMDTLGLSLGSASQGLKTLRTLKAVKVAPKKQGRADAYVAETNFRHLVSGFLKEEIIPELDGTRAGIQKMKTLQKDLSVEDAQFFKPRIKQAQNLNSAARKLIPIINQFLKA